MVDLREALRPLVEFPVAEPEPLEQVARRVAGRRRRRRLAAAGGFVALVLVVSVAAGVWSAVGSDSEEVRVAGPSASESSRPGGGLELTYIPEGFALVDDVEHVRHEFGDRLRVLTYRSGDADGGTFEVHRKAGNPLDIAAELQLESTMAVTKVNGHEGVVRTTPEVALGWLQTSDVTFWVTSPELAEPEIRRIAEGIRYDPTKDNLSLGEFPGPVDPGDQNRQLSRRVVAAAGEVDDVRWQLEVYESDAGLCADLRYYRGASGGCGFDVPEHRALGIQTAHVHGQQAIFGPVRKDVATIDFHLASGEVTTVTPVGEGLGFPVHFYLSLLPTDNPAEVIVAFDTAGNEVARESPQDRADTGGD